MRDLPIMFSGPLPVAVRAGDKTVTRRLLNPQPSVVYAAGMGITRSKHPAEWTPIASDVPTEQEWASWRLKVRPRWAPGDRCWVRERARVIWASALGTKTNAIIVRYESDQSTSPVIAMPPRCLAKPRVGLCLPYGGFREVSRTTIEILNTRVEPLQSITEQDAVKEGVFYFTGMLEHETLSARAKHMQAHSDDAKVWFAEIWDRIHGRNNPWQSNPEIVRIEFAKI